MLLTNGPSSHTASELMPNDTVSRMPGHARADAIVDIADDHRVGERDRTEDEHHDREQRGEQPPALRVSRERQQRNLHQDDDEIQRLQRHAVDHAADENLRKRGHRIDRRQQPAEHGGIVDDAEETLGQELRVAVRREIEQQAAGDGRRGHHDECAGEHRRRQRDAGAALPLRWRLGFLGAHAREHDAEEDARDARDGERCAPTEPFDEQAGDERGERDAEIAGQTVDADRRARIARVLHEHRDADRVIDRCERADERERGRELPRVLNGRAEQRGGAHAEEEHEHHRAPAPEVAEATGRQRSQPEQEERPDAERHQVFPAREAEVDGNR